MSITDELREWCVDRVFMGNGYAEVLGIADRIDAAHRSALEKLAAQVGESERSGFDQGFASADDWLAQNEDAMKEHGWVRLPVDAYGETIHGGDEMCSMNGDVLGRVTGIGVCERTGWVWILRNGRNVSTGCDAITLRHHHVQTVEGVLREFALACEDAGNAGPKVNRLAAEFAAKLRLAGEDA